MWRRTYHREGDDHSMIVFCRVPLSEDDVPWPKHIVKALRTASNPCATAKDVRTLPHPFHEVRMPLVASAIAPDVIHMKIHVGGSVLGANDI